ncbi:hypothetical protein ES703_79250 [subsurface metagenome]
MSCRAGLRVRGAGRQARMRGVDNGWRGKGTGVQKPPPLVWLDVLCYTFFMVKLKSPLISLDARGTLIKALTFVRRRKQNIVEAKPEPKDAKTGLQLSWRTMFLLAVDLWHALSAEEKRVWESAGTARHMTGYAWFISQALRPNPGIYLPLLGGTMQGAIGMAGHEIKDLPDPGLAQDAATKDYVDVSISNLAWAKFLNDTPSGIGAYYEMSPSPTEHAKSTFSSGLLDTGDDQALFQWISDDVVSFETILAGIIRVHIHAQRTAGNKSIELYAELYEYTEAAAEILITTTDLCDPLTDDESCNELHAPLVADYDIAPTSKLLIKFLANVGVAGASVTLNLYAEGLTTSSVSLPTPTSPLIDAEIAFHASIPAAHHTDLAAIEFVIDGGGGAIETGEKGHLEVPFAGTILQVSLLADQDGAIKVDIWKDTYANFPPADGDSICGGNEPEIAASGKKYQDSTLTAWTKELAAGAILAFNVDSIATITRVLVSLLVRKS